MGKTVFTNGCFDVLHPGHFNLLMRCRQLAESNGSVVMAIDSDRKVSADKGLNRPIFDQNARQTALLDLTYFNGFHMTALVDQVRIFDTNEELHSIIKDVKPDIIVKGTDWAGNVVGSDLASVYLELIIPQYSTTKTVDRILQRTLSYDFRNEVLLDKEEL